MGIYPSTAPLSSLLQSLSSEAGPSSMEKDLSTHTTDAELSAVDKVELESKKLFDEFMQLNCPVTTSVEETASTLSTLEMHRLRMDSGYQEPSEYHPYYNLDSRSLLAPMPMDYTFFTPSHSDPSSLRHRRPVPHDLSVVISSRPDPSLDSPYSSSTSSSTLVSDFLQAMKPTPSTHMPVFDFAIDPTLTMIQHKVVQDQVDKSYGDTSSDVSCSVVTATQSPCITDSPFMDPPAGDKQGQLYTPRSQESTSFSDTTSHLDVTSYSVTEPSVSSPFERNVPTDSPLVLSDMVRAYLEHPHNEFTLVMNQPKVAQKSYGGEKRFICPPPLCVVFGDGWGIPREPQFPASRHPRENRGAALPDTLFSPISAEIRISQEHRIDSIGVSFPRDSTPSTSVWNQSRPCKKSYYGDDDCSETSEYMEVDDDRQDPSYGSKSKWRYRKLRLVSSLNKSRSNGSSIHMLELARVDGLSKTSSIRDQVCYTLNGLSRTPRFVMPCLFKGLHISDGDTFPLFVDILGADQIQLMTFESSPMRVISKPSKSSKKELMICSGSTIALFNRVRAQTGSTKFLSVSADGSHFVPRTSFWDNFVIWHVDDPHFTPWHPHKSSHIPLLIARLKQSQEDSLDSWARQEIETLTLKLGHGMHTKDQHDLVWTRPAPLPIPRLQARDDIESISILRMIQDRWGSDAWTAENDYEETVDSSYARPHSTNRSTGHSMLTIKESPIYYGDTVVLQNLNTGLVSKPLVIRNVPKTTFAQVENYHQKNAGDRDPVSQLHKIAFELQGQPGCYFSISQGDEQGMCAHPGVRCVEKQSKKTKFKGKKRKRRAESDSDDPEGDDNESVIYSDDVGELGVWTIVGTVQNEVTFHIPPSVYSCPDSNAKQKPSQNMHEQLAKLDIHPIPKVTLIKQHSSHLITLYGENFDGNRHVVFFGPFRAKRTEFKGNGLLLVQVPPLNTTQEAWNPSGEKSQESCYGMNEIDADIQWDRLTVPILIARQDGVIYRTGQYIKLQ